MYYVYGLQLYVRNCIVHTAGTYTGARIMYLVYMKTSHVCGVPKNEKMRGNHTVGTEQDGLSTAALVFISTAQQLFDTAAGSSSRHSSSSSSHSRATAAAAAAAGGGSYSVGTSYYQYTKYLASLSLSSCGLYRDSLSRLRLHSV